MTGYQTGKRAEKRSAEYLEKMGYYIVKSEASKGIFDLVGVYVGDRPSEFYAVRCVQVKRGSSPLEDDGHKLAYIRNLISSDDIVVEIHHWSHGAHKPSVIPILKTNEKTNNITDAATNISS